MGRGEVGRERRVTLSYADDIILMAVNDKEMRSMLGRLEGYLESKKIELNVDKSKVVRFKKQRERWKRREWKWKGKRIEELKKIKYVRYVMQRSGEHQAHIRDMVRKAKVTMRQV